MKSRVMESIQKGAATWWSILVVASIKPKFLKTAGTNNFTPEIIKNHHILDHTVNYTVKLARAKLPKLPALHAVFL